MALSDEDIPATVPLAAEPSDQNVIAKLVPQQPCSVFPPIALSSSLMEVSIGRRPSCDVVLQSAHASGRHAELVARRMPNGTYSVWLTDLR